MVNESGSERTAMWEAGNENSRLPVTLTTALGHKRITIMYNRSSSGAHFERSLPLKIALHVS